MRALEKVPSFHDLLAEATRSGRLGAILENAHTLAPQMDYYHWDELRYRPLPSGLTREEWWLSLKLNRAANYRILPFGDASGKSFRFSFPDILLQRLHEIDMQAGPGMRVGQLVSKEHRDFYLMHSLMEEAITSSQLEGAPTTRLVAQEMIQTKREPRDRGERMIYNNFQAMKEIAKHCNEPLSPDFILSIHRIITEGTLKNPSDAGRLRAEGEDVHVVDSEGMEYHRAPASGALLRKHVEDLCAFANETSASQPAGFVPPAVRAIILHFWLAYEHPFVDGNGRTARALMYWSMLHQGFWMFEFIAISEILAQAPSQYEKAYLYSETDDNDATYFLIHQTGVILNAVRALNDYIARKQREMADIDQRLANFADVNFRQRTTLTRLMKHPEMEISVKGYQELCRVSYATARSDLLALEAQGFLTHRKEGKAVIYRSRKLPIPPPSGIAVPIAKEPGR